MDVKNVDGQQISHVISITNQMLIKPFKPYCQAQSFKQLSRKRKKQLKSQIS